MTHLPLEVTAHLATPVVAAHPWGIALDGLLAAQLWADLVATTPDDQVPWPSETAVPPDLALPLARCTLADDQWHWAATCSLPDTSLRQTSWRYKPTPAHVTEALAVAMPAGISPGSRWSRRETPDILRPAHHLAWRAVGDPERIQQLLVPVTALGKGRHRGDGQILGWTITPHPDADPWEFAHLHPGGRIGRPCPTACLPAHLTGDSTPIWAGLRPPSMHPARQHLLHVPSR